MNKNKLIVMFITFAVLIAVTPLIFGKLMNSKFNQMLNDLRSKGMKIEVVKDKSSYLQTDKVLEVTLPAKLLNDNGIIDEVKLKVETKFKNLPVTNVIFSGKLEKIVLAQPYKNSEKELNDFIGKFIHFTVTTPNFKDYSYKFDDIVINDTPKFGIEEIKGVFSNSDIFKNKLTIKDIYIKDQKGFIEVKNLKNQFEGNDKESYSKTEFNLNVNVNQFQLQVQNVSSTTKTVLDKKVCVVSTLGFESLIVPNTLSAKKLNIKAELKGVDRALLEKLAVANEYEKETYIDQIFEKGFDININSNLKDVTVMNRKMGGYELSLNIKFLPEHNFREKVNTNNIDFVNAKLHLVTTPEIASLLMNTVPQSSFLFALAKKENGQVILNLEFKQGKLYSEGQLIQ